jgi:capsular exopolysaccharide synthesis family protein
LSTDRVPAPKKLGFQIPRALGQSLQRTFLRRRRPSAQPLEPAAPGEGKALAIQREEIVLARDAHGHVAEQFRRLRNALQALNPDGAARSVLITSAVSGEGKSIATINLALALAELPNVGVCVVDGNADDPAIERYFGLPERQGLSELLRGRLVLDQAVRPTSVERLDVIGAGASAPNSAELLNVDRLRAVLHALKRRFDYVLIDSPAVLAVNHPTVMGSVVDGILLVVRLGKTPKSLVEDAYRQLESLGGNVLGTCVTGADEPLRG